MSSKQKVYLLALVSVMVIVSYSPLIASLFLFVDMGISTHDWMVFVISPYLSFALMIVIPGLTAKRVPVQPVDEIVWFRRRGSEFVWMLLLPVVAIAVTGFIGFLLAGVGVRRTNPIWYTDRSLYFALFYSLGVALFCPIAEEVFWRGSVQSRLAKVCGPFLALVVQAAAFALCHFRYTGARAQVFALGLIFGLWRWKKKSLIPIIMAHMALNTLTVVFDWQDRGERGRVNPSVDYVAELNRLSTSTAGDPNDNAALFYKEAFALGVAMPDAVNFDEYKNWPGTWSEEQNTAIRNWITANAESLELIRCGSKKGHYHKVYRGRDMFGLVESELPMARDLSFALSARSRVRALDGDVEQGLSDVVVCCRFGLHFRGPKTTLEQLLGIAISAISVEKAFSILHEVDPDEGLLENMQMELEAILARTDHRFDFVDERMRLHDGIQRVFTDDGKGGGRIPDVEVKNLQNPPSELSRILGDTTFEGWEGLDRMQTVSLVDAVFDYIDTAQLKTPFQLRSEGIDIQAAINEMTRHNGFIHTLLVNAGMLTSFAYQFKSQLQALITTLAVERFQMSRGSLPRGLDELVVAGFLEELYQDPFSDKPPHYRRMKGTFILYSNGFDCEDDGGVHDKHWGRDGDGDFVFWPVTSEEELH